MYLAQKILKEMEDLVFIWVASNKLINQKRRINLTIYKQKEVIDGVYSQITISIDTMAISKLKPNNLFNTHKKDNEDWIKNMSNPNHKNPGTAQSDSMTVSIS